ncbi:MAG: hypothetical protein ACJAYU_001369 [Bradymonadia bacterium]|jgi:hypothetical protein
MKSLVTSALPILELSFAAYSVAVASSSTVLGARTDEIALHACPIRRTSIHPLRCMLPKREVADHAFAVLTALVPVAPIATLPAVKRV